ncbi:MAG: Flp pilus assembly protein CpaB [Burkholderiaceae bacterium]
MTTQSGIARVSGLAKWRSVLLFIGAIGFGAIGVTGTRGYISESLQSEKDRLASVQRTVATVVAKANLPVGATVGPTTMAIRQMPAAFLPPTAVLAEQFDDVVGLELLVSMTGGQALLKTAVSEPNQGFSERVGHGIRAMTVAVDEVNSVSGMLSPGDRIDLLFSTRAPDISGQQVGEITTPLMQDLLVLATGQRTAHDRNRRQTMGAGSAGGFTSITVEVTPDQAQRLVLAQGSGRLTALLRNPQDRREQTSSAMDVYTLLGIPRPGRKQAVRSSGPEVIIGGLGPISSGRPSAVVPNQIVSPTQPGLVQDHE